MIAWALSTARLLQYGSAFILFGSTLFGLYGLPISRSVSSTEEGTWHHLGSLTAAVTGCLATLAWLTAEAISLGGTARALPEVIADTRFGHAAALRLALFAFAAILTLAPSNDSTLRIVATALGAAIVTSFAWTGHGTLGSGAAAGVHAIADVLHLLAAAIWVGALFDLSGSIVRACKTHSAESALRIVGALARFSAIGPTVVSVIILSGLINSWMLIGPTHWRSLLDFAYGITLSIKLAFFLLMLALGALHRYRTTPALQATLATQADFGPVLRRLRNTLILETVLGLIVLASVAVLGDLKPPVSMS